jgi:hypothetical protein
VLRPAMVAVTARDPSAPPASPAPGAANEDAAAAQGNENQS